MNCNKSFFRKVVFMAVFSLIAITTAAYGIFPMTSPETVQTTAQMGSRGTQVKAIQEQLRDLGLYNGGIDGVFGASTKKALMNFQKQNGLAADGIAGTATLKKLNIGSLPAATNDNVALLARVISGEARGESYIGQVAVGAVILNRVEHPSFPDTLSGVVYQKGAFDAVWNGQVDQDVPDSCYQAARDAINGWDPSGGALYYYNPDKTSNKWIRTRPVITRIGDHLFCS